MSALEQKMVLVPPRSRWAVGLKRAIDIVAAGTALIILAPVMLAIALAVLIVDGRPILYRWRVVGKEGHAFLSYKFRTMVRDADRMREDLLRHNQMEGPVFKMRMDPRVTWLGRILRRTSLDELPQLVSVLRGAMSLVGPRPPLVSEYQRFTPFQRTKLAVKPGITCLWQVSGRNEIRDFDEWVRLDREYIERWSLWLDLKILARTVKTVVTGRGAA